MDRAERFALSAIVLLGVTVLFEAFVILYVNRISNKHDTVLRAITHVVHIAGTGCLIGSGATMLHNGNVLAFAPLLDVGAWFMLLAACLVALFVHQQTARTVDAKAIEGDQNSSATIILTYVLIGIVTAGIITEILFGALEWTGARWPLDVLALLANVIIFILATTMVVGVHAAIGSAPSQEQEALYRKDDVHTWSLHHPLAWHTLMLNVRLASTFGASIPTFAFSLRGADAETAMRILLIWAAVRAGAAAATLAATRTLHIRILLDKASGKRPPESVP